MFRRLESSLPPDPSFPADLTALGYFVNEHDQLRQIAHPTETFAFNISKNDRVKEMHKEAMNECIRKMVTDRLTSPPSCLSRVLLPLGATEAQPHVPILVSSDLRSRKHVVVLIPDFIQDLGIIAYRYIGSVGISAGSVVCLAEKLQSSAWSTTAATSTATSTSESSPSDPVATTANVHVETETTTAPGLVIANPGQLTYRRRTQTPMTLVSWHAIPRPTAVSLPPRIGHENQVPGNESPQRHLLSILDDILSNPDYVAPDARFYIIGVAEGGAAFVKHLSSRWSSSPSFPSGRWLFPRIAALALTDPQHDLKNLVYDRRGERLDPGFLDFLASRTRAYCLSAEGVAVGTPVIRGRETFGCNCYASGEEFYGEVALCKCWEDVVGWFKLVAGLGGRYREVDVPISMPAPRLADVQTGGTNADIVIDTGVDRSVKVDGDMEGGENGLDVD